MNMTEVPNGNLNLLDMLRIFAGNYITLGRRIEEVRALIDGHSSSGSPPPLGERMSIQTLLQEMSNLCSEIGLPVSQDLIHRTMRTHLPASAEFETVVAAISAELKTKIFLYVSSDRVSYVDRCRAELVTISDKFPRAILEIEAACKCYAFGLGTPSVFHAMRATEIGVQVMARALGVLFPYPIELAEWGKIVGEIEPKINAFKIGARSAEKDAELKFYSEAASQFRHFNNGWRIRVSHARESYSDDDARDVIEHVVSFFKTLAERLSEVASADRCLSYRA